MRIPRPTLLMRPEGVRDQDGAISLSTPSGPIRQVPGRYGNAWRVNEATINYLLNPSAEVDLESIDAMTFATRTRDAQNATAGSWSVKVITPGSSALEGIRYATGGFAGTTVRPYRGSVDLAGSGTVRLWTQIVYTDATVSSGAYVLVSLTGTPTRYVAPGVSSTSGKTIAAIYLLICTHTTQAITFWSDAAQIEQKSYWTMYADGSMGSGYSWSGTAHASYSSRLTTGLYAALRKSPFKKNQGTILARVRFRPSGSSQAPGYLYTSAGQSRFGAGRFNAISTVTPRFASITSGGTLNYGPAFADEEWVTIAAKVIPKSNPAESGWDFRMRRADGTWVDGSLPTGMDLETDIRRAYAAVSVATNYDLESVAYWDEVLTDAQILEVENIPRAWTWEELSGDYGRLTNIITRSGGAYAVSTELYLADRSGRKLERLPIDLPVEGQISFNEDARPSRKFALNVNDPLRLEPFVDYVIPVVVLTDAAGNREEGQFGHFMATPPAEYLTQSQYSGALEGMDATWILDQDDPGNVTIPAGTDTGEAARELALAVMDASQVQLPDTGVPLLEDWQPSPGESRYQIIADLYGAADWYIPVMDGNGVLVTEPYKDLATAAAFRTYGTEEGTAQILPPASGTPDWWRLRNRVIVRNIRPDQAPIYGRASVTNAASPLHPDRLGGGGRPLWLTLKVDDNQVATNAEAKKKAELLLANAASWYRKLSIQTVIDLQAGAHQILELNLVHQGARYEGTWLRRAWNVNLRGLTAMTQAEVTRTEKWQP